MIKEKLKKNWKNIVFNLIFVILNLIVVILFYKNIILTALLLCILSIIGFFKWKSKLMIIIFIFFGILFGIAEIIFVNYGVWTYSFTNIFNIPPWLFILWGNTAMFVYQMILEIKKFIN